MAGGGELDGQVATARALLAREHTHSGDSTAFGWQRGAQVTANVRDRCRTKQCGERAGQCQRALYIGPCCCWPRSWTAPARSCAGMRGNRGTCWAPHIPSVYTPRSEPSGRYCHVSLQSNWGGGCASGASTSTCCPALVRPVCERRQRSGACADPADEVGRSTPTQRRIHDQSSSRREHPQTRASGAHTPGHDLPSLNSGPPNRGLKRRHTDTPRQLSTKSARYGRFRSRLRPLQNVYRCWVRVFHHHS